MTKADKYAWTSQENAHPNRERRSSWRRRMRSSTRDDSQVLQTQLQNFDVRSAIAAAIAETDPQGRRRFSLTQKHHIKRAVPEDVKVELFPTDGKVHPGQALEASEEYDRARSNWTRAIRKTVNINRLDKSADAERHRPHEFWTTSRAGERPPFGMIHPANPCLRAWTIFVLSLLIWVAIILPIDLCFDLKGKYHFFEVFDYVIDVAFLIDLMSNFFVGYRVFMAANQAYEVEFDRVKVAHRYLIGWFSIDLVACLASIVDEIFAAAKVARMPRLFRLFRMARVLRLLKIMKMREELRDVRGLSLMGDLRSMSRSGLVQVAKIFGMLVVVAHWAGSIWYLLSAWNWRVGWQMESHMDQKTCGDASQFTSCRAYDCEQQDKSWIKAAGLCNEEDDLMLYLTSVYWAFSTLSTVGYGDISAQNSAELCFSLLMMMSGVVGYSAFAGSVVNMISRFNASVKLMNDKRDKLSKFCKDHSLPKPLRQRLFDHLEFSLHNMDVGGTIAYELDSLLIELGPQLRTETILYLHKDLIASMSFFRDKNEDFIVLVVADLRPRIAYPRDVVLRRGDKAEAMFFLNKGKAIVLAESSNSEEGSKAEAEARQGTEASGADADGAGGLGSVGTGTISMGSGYAKILNTVKAGDFFGEIGCLLNRPRQNTVMAVELTELYTLERRRVLEIMAEYPVWADEVREKALARISKQDMEEARNRRLQSRRITENDEIRAAAVKVAAEASGETATLPDTASETLNESTSELADKILVGEGPSNPLSFQLEPQQNDSDSWIGTAISAIAVAIKTCESNLVDKLDQMQQAQQEVTSQIAELKAQQATMSKQLSLSRVANVED